MFCMATNIVIYISLRNTNNIPNRSVIRQFNGIIVLDLFYSVGHYTFYLLHYKLSIDHLNC